MQGESYRLRARSVSAEAKTGEKDRHCLTSFSPHTQPHQATMGISPRVDSTVKSEGSRIRIIDRYRQECLPLAKHS